jgi:hypothetical protein
LPLFRWSRTSAVNRLVDGFLKLYWPADQEKGNERPVPFVFHFLFDY